MVGTLKHLEYSERLRALMLPSLKYRQTRGDLIQTYKVLHKVDNINPDNFFQLSSNKTRGDDLKLFKDFAKSDVRRNFLSYRINDLWNSLSTNTKMAPNILTFKIAVDSELSHLRYEYND